MYPSDLVAPMKNDLTVLGFQELLNPEEVDQVLSQISGTTFLVINSVCGCAAGTARPGVKHALENSTKKPDRLATVFAGVDKEAVDQARTYTIPYPASSPSMALFKDGKLVHFIERHHIEGRSAQAIGEHLKVVFNEFC